MFIFGNGIQRIRVRKIEGIEERTIARAPSIVEVANRARKLEIWLGMWEEASVQ